MSTWINSNGALVLIELKGKGLRAYLARGQIEQSSIEQKCIILVDKEMAHRLLLDRWPRR